eukprot:scaffold853_cov386-Prasinococcus_capsulatus_cf.AAC.12
MTDICLDRLVEDSEERLKKENPLEGAPAFLTVRGKSQRLFLSNEHVSSGDQVDRIYEELGPKYSMFLDVHAEYSRPELIDMVSLSETMVRHIVETRDDRRMWMPTHVSQSVVLTKRVVVS